MANAKLQYKVKAISEGWTTERASAAVLQAIRDARPMADVNITLGMWFRVYFDLGIREQDHRGALMMKGEA